MIRPVLYDATHLIHRYAYDAPSGIDRVDLAYGRHFGLKKGKITAGIHYGNVNPRVLSQTRVAEAVVRLEERWREDLTVNDDKLFKAVEQWLAGKATLKPSVSVSVAEAIEKKFKIGILPFLRYAASRRLLSSSSIIPDGAIYLNIAQHAMERGDFFAWLDQRKDLFCVFFLHDLLPLDYPEFWWKKHDELFDRRINTMAAHADALITSSKDVKERAKIEMARRGKPNIPIFAYPLPSPLEFSTHPKPVRNELEEKPFFIIIGTIEPRKNHSLLLNIWRELAVKGGFVPKLVIVGKRGWKNEQAVGLLERCPEIQPYVLEISGLSNAGLIELIYNARALLMPSFAEGYGLPIIEALTLNTPVLASDIPIFREVSQGKAIFVNPIDATGWKNAILALADSNSDLAQEARAQARTYIPVTTASYFKAIEDFLAGL